jgi:hypothetical protein
MAMALVRLLDTAMDEGQSQSAAVDSTQMSAVSK